MLLPITTFLGLHVVSAILRHLLLRLRNHSRLLRGILLERLLARTAHILGPLRLRSHALHVLIARLRLLAVDLLLHLEHHLQILYTLVVRGVGHVLD